MYFTLLSIFILGTAVGITLARSGLYNRVVKKSDQDGNLSHDNPFLDEADKTEADELRTDAAEAVQNRIEKRKERIVAKAKAEGRITNDGVEDLFCISDRTAGRYLTELVEEGHLTKVGSTGRWVYYEPI